LPIPQPAARNRAAKAPRVDRFFIFIILKGIGQKK
jgi:hypothetical protein